MRLNKTELARIIIETLDECGEPMPQADADGLSGVLDQLSDATPELKAGHGGSAKMARGHLYHIANRAQSLHDRLTDKDQLPEWAQSKLAVAEAMVNSVFDHLDYKMHVQKKGM